MDSVPHFEDEKSIKLFSSHKVFSEREIHARTEILLENYYKTVNIEALTAVDMVRRSFIPAVTKYEKFMCDAAISKKTLGIDITSETEQLKILSELKNRLSEETAKLDSLIEQAKSCPEVKEKAVFYHDSVLSKMSTVRDIADELELLVGKDYWPIPTYGDILFSVS